MNSEFQFNWQVDDQRNLYSPAGTWIGRLGDGCILLYDRRLKTHIPFTLQDWQRLLNTTPTTPDVQRDEAG